MLEGQILEFWISSVPKEEFYGSSKVAVYPSLACDKHWNCTSLMCGKEQSVDLLCICTGVIERTICLQDYNKQEQPQMNCEGDCVILSCTKAKLHGSFPSCRMWLTSVDLIVSSGGKLGLAVAVLLPELFCSLEVWHTRSSYNWFQKPGRCFLLKS